VLSGKEFRALVSGERRGVTAGLLRTGLAVAEWPYALAMQWRNRRFDRDPRRAERVGVPVVSVGNLTLGGTGKTPLVEWVARWYRRHRVRVAIISRGYGAEQGALNDEAIELEQKLPDVPHLQNPDRVAAARTAIEELECELIVLDDAFQHRRIARDLDLVLLDAAEPFGFGRVFPRGTLREPLVGLRRAQAVILSRADMISADARAGIHAVVQRHAPEAVWARHGTSPAGFLHTAGRIAPRVAPRPAHRGVCGIGNPKGFRHTLASSGYDLVELREFPDHHRYTRDDVESLARWADGLDVAAVVCTHKDLVKIGLERLGRRPLQAVVIRLDWLAGEDTVADLLQRLLPDQSIAAI
jgi:tetraacyldisaccharide 4'-kinase